MKDFRYISDVDKEAVEISKDLELLRSFEESTSIFYVQISKKLLGKSIDLLIPDITSLKIYDIIKTIENVLRTLSMYRTYLVTEHLTERGCDRAISRIDRLSYCASMILDKCMKKIQLSNDNQFNQFMQKIIKSVTDQFNVSCQEAYSQINYIDQKPVVVYYAKMQSENRIFYLIFAWDFTDFYCDISYEWQRVEYLLPQLKTRNIKNAVSKFLRAENIALKTASAICAIGKQKIEALLKDLNASSEGQKIYVKYSTDKEKQIILNSVKALLKSGFSMQCEDLNQQLTISFNYA